MSSGALEYTNELLADHAVQVSEEAPQYDADDLLKHYYDCSDHMFLHIKAEQYAAYLDNDLFLADLKYNSSDTSVGAVLVSSDITSHIIDQLDRSVVQKVLHKALQNNHFAQDTLHNKYPYLIVHMASLPTTKDTIRMISAFVRGHQGVSSTFLEWVGIEWIRERISLYPRELQCMGHHLGMTLKNDAIMNMFVCE